MPRSESDRKWYDDRSPLARRRAESKFMRETSPPPPLSEVYRNIDRQAGNPPRVRDVIWTSRDLLIVSALVAAIVVIGFFIVRALV